MTEHSAESVAAGLTRRTNHLLVLVRRYAQASVCRQMIHGIPNENMQPWMETGRGAYCLLCFAAAWDEVEPEEWALYDDGEAQ